MILSTPTHLGSADSLAVSDSCHRLSCSARLNSAEEERASTEVILQEDQGTPGQTENDRSPCLGHHSGTLPSPGRGGQAPGFKKKPRGGVTSKNTLLAGRHRRLRFYCRHWRRGKARSSPSVSLDPGVSGSSGRPGCLAVRVFSFPGGGTSSFSRSSRRLKKKKRKRKEEEEGRRRERGREQKPPKRAEKQPNFG